MQPALILRQLRTALTLSADAPDGLLLKRFADHRDESAFTALVSRHGPLVWGVCRRLLPDADAEEVFQATFLALARQAEGIRQGTAVGSWLYGVARRLALQVRRQAARRSRHEKAAAAGALTAAADDPAGRELLSILDEELGRLSEAYRAPLVACYLQGLPREQAARQLGWSVSTLGRRLERGRELLRRRLTGRGVAPAALPAFEPLSVVKAPVAPRLAEGAVRAALGAEAASASVASLAAEAARAAGWSQGKWVAALLLTALTAGGLTALLRGPGPEPARSLAFAPAPAVDRPEDPLPPGAVGRLGSPRFRHPGEVTCLRFSPDGKTLLAGGAQGDHAVYLWDAATGALRRRLPFGRGVTALAFARDGERVAAAAGLFGGDKEAVVGIWDASTGKELHRLEVREAVFGLDFSPDGKVLGLNTAKHKVLLWEPGKRPRELVGHRGEGHELVFSPDGKRLAGGATEWRDPDNLEGAYYVIRLWDMTTGKAVHELRGHEGSIRALAFSPDGRHLASGGRDEKNSVRLWDVATGKELPALPKRRGEALALWFSPDGRTLLAADGDGGGRGWRLPAGKALPPPPKLQALLRPAEAVAFSPDGKRLARGAWVGAAGRANAIHLWDLTTGKPLARRAGHEGEVTRLAFSADGKRLASGGGDGAALWDVPKRRLVRQFRAAGGADTAVGALALSPDGTVLATGPQTGPGVRLWEAATGKERTAFTWPESEQVINPPGVKWLCFSPDGKALAAAEWVPGAYKMLLWPVPAAGRPAPPAPRVFKSPGEELFPGGFSRDGKTLTAGTGAGVASWEVATGKQTLRAGRAVDFHKALGDWADAVALSPDGRLLAVGCRNGVLSLWTTATGREAARLRKASEDYWEGIASVAFSPDGRLLVAGGLDGRIRFWDVASRKELGQRAGHTGGVRALLFSPDGKTLASGGADTTVLLWDVAPILKRRGAGAKE